MPIWKKRYKTDTLSEIYSNLDRLFSLIKVAMEKEQAKNGERYIKYFFEVMVKYYQKNARPPQLASNRQAKAKITTETTAEATEISGPTTLFPDRSIGTPFGDYFTERVIQLHTDNIRSGRYEVFHFVISLLKDSIRILIKDKDTFIRASSLLRQFKFISDQIFHRESELSDYEKSWYLNQTYNWFMELYGGSVKKLPDLELFQMEMLQILKSYIERDRVDIFESFLTRLSSSSFSLSYAEDQMVKATRPQNSEMASKYDDFIYIKKQQAYRIQTPSEFEDLVKQQSLFLETNLASIGLSTEQAELFKETLFRIMLDQFKESYIKVFLIKTMTYAFYQKKFDFFDKYLNYNQPGDADAVWANAYYGIRNLQDLFEIIKRADTLILGDSMFYIGHHGFQIYLYSFFAYYFLKFPEEDLLSYINLQLNYADCIQLVGILQKIRTSSSLSSLLSWMRSKQLEIDENRFSFLEETANSRAQAIQYRKTTDADISEAIYSGFRKRFIDTFHQNSTLRLIFKETRNYIEEESEREVIRGLGINELIYKSAFVEQQEHRFFNLPEGFAQGLAESENLTLLFSMERGAKKIKLSREEFMQYLKDNRSEYDVILSKGIYGIKSDLPELPFTESWAISSTWKNIPDYLGKLDEHFQVFFIRHIADEGYLLLNSKKMGLLKQFGPPAVKEGIRDDIFNFSLIDFKNDGESLQLQTKGSLSEKELLTYVWLRVFEKFDFLISDGFNGISVELTS